jgi:hypothetical protein
MRVLLRNRNGSKERPQPVSESTSLLLPQSRVTSALGSQKSTIRDMKDYVRSRMRTDYDQSSAKKETLESRPEIQGSPVRQIDGGRNSSGSQSLLALSRTMHPDEPPRETDRMSRSSKVQFLTLSDL